MEFKQFIGMDVSKLTLDVTMMQGNDKRGSIKIENSLKGLKQLWKEIVICCPDFTIESAVFCMEHTGIYNEHLLSFLRQKNAHICLENPVEIKYSNGFQRGKNDKVDADRIAMYAYKERDSLKLWDAPRDVIKKLKDLAALRTRLINVKKILTVPNNELKQFRKSEGKLMESLSSGTIKHLEKDLNKVELEINQTIKGDETLSRLFKLTTSVKGVGKVTAVEMIICTNEFKSIREPQKFACYAGVVPFDHSSGSSIKGKPRVSHKANKRIKTLLHMGSIIAISYNQDIKNYYERKVKEGKNKMSVLNAVRNKLIHRIFACVRENRVYQN